MIHHLSGLFSRAGIAPPPQRGNDRKQRRTRGSGQMRRTLLIMLGLMVAIPTASHGQVDPAKLNPVSGRSPTLEEVIPADVLARVELLRAELEMIRFEMGAQKKSSPDIAVSEVAPREVIYQAFTLYGKANRLRAELTGNPGPALRVSRPEEIKPFHVLVIVDAAYRIVHGAKHSLGITEPVEEILQDESVAPGDVYKAIVQANQQFDALYGRQISAADTYKQMMRATQLVAILIKEFPDAALMSAIPDFQHGKQPLDVYRLLNKCYQRIHSLLEHSGLKAMTLQIPPLDGNSNDADRIGPSNVYDLTVLLASELDYLHVQLKGAETPSPTPAPSRGFKVPSHVYQWAEVLLLQLTELEKQVIANPDWLAP